MEQEQSAIIEINYDILNTLNLANEDLGKRYEQTGEQPFEKNFEMKKGFVDTLLKNAKEKELDCCPNFLNFGAEQVSQNFNNALLATDKLIDSLSNTQDEQKQDVEEMLNLLKLRKASLMLAVEKIVQKNANSVAIYNDVRKISPLIDDILKESYEKEIEEKFALDKIMFVVMNNAQEKQKQAVKEKAKTINAKISKAQENEKEQKQEKQEKVNSEKTEKTVEDNSSFSS